MNTFGTFLSQKFEDMRRALAFFTVLPVRGRGILYKSQPLDDDILIKIYKALQTNLQKIVAFCPTVFTIHGVKF